MMLAGLGLLALVARRRKPKEPALIQFRPAAPAQTPLCNRVCFLRPLLSAAIRYRRGSGFRRCV